MAVSDDTTAESVLASFAVPKLPLYLIGIFERGVTVYSQQIRAFNLIWALVQRNVLNCNLGKEAAKTDPVSIAIIGGGFAGLSAAAALLKKGVNARITIFEHRDTLLPLQHGSDTRWLHPRIYNWPQDGSESAVAMLPILNWTAARASDVAAQILQEWRDLAAKEYEKDRDKLTVYCNAQHLQIHELADGKTGLTIEWVGDRRRYDGSVDSLNASMGGTSVFDHVIMAVGYGLEKESKVSYWRNDTLGQPSLEKPHRTYLVSGQGDGAMIDVLRLRISQYRQDRILEELFVGLPDLDGAIKELRKRYGDAKPGMFSAFEKLADLAEFKNVREKLIRRLRRDTEVILHLEERMFADLFEKPQIKISFQNRLLIYLLYKCGGFIPTSDKIQEVERMHGIPENQVIKRHGTDKHKSLSRLLSEDLYGAVKSHFEADPAPSQPETIHWQGGYFGFPGSSEAAKTLDDDAVRQEWRKEYLPGPTALASLSLCSSVAGVLLGNHPAGKRLRVTLHRTMTVGEEVLLQQCCEYLGANIPLERPAVGRTFPAANATIGLAYRCREIVRSLQSATPDDLRQAMTSLDLNTASRKMSSQVGFVLAIPILQPENANAFSGPSPVAGVLYIDSEAPNYFIADEDVRKLTTILAQFMEGAVDFRASAASRIRNLPTGKRRADVPAQEPLQANVANVLELVKAVSPPRASSAFQLNFDFADFVPV